MKSLRALAVAIVVSAAVGLTACAPAEETPVIAPVTVEANDLQGKTVTLVLGQTLNINTGDLPVDSYSAEVSDPSVLSFVPGREDDSATFNPGFTAVRVGESDVTMTNRQGGIQPIEFTVTISPESSSAP